MFASADHVITPVDVEKVNPVGKAGLMEKVFTTFADEGVTTGVVLDI